MDDEYHPDSSEIEASDSLEVEEEQKFWYSSRKFKVVLVIFMLLVPLLWFTGGIVVYGIVASTGACDSHAENQPNAWWAHLYNGERVERFNSTNWTIDSWENVSIKVESEDIELAGWWFEGEVGKPAIIGVHGVRSCKSNHEVLLPATMLHKAGYSVLLIDLRDHGESTVEDGKVSAGQKEWRDVRAAFDWVNSTHNISTGRIGLFGSSMGAATSAIAFAQDERIEAAFLDTAFADMDLIIESELIRAGFPTILGPAAVLAGKLLSGEDITKHTPLDAANNLGDRHLFIAHNQGDLRVPIVHAEMLCEAGAESVSELGSLECWYADTRMDEGVGVGPEYHVVAMLTETEEYQRRIVGFFDSSFGIER